MSESLSLVCDDYKFQTGGIFIWDESTQFELIKTLSQAIWAHSAHKRANNNNRILCYKLIISHSIRIIIFHMQMIEMRLYSLFIYASNEYTLTHCALRDYWISTNFPDTFNKISTFNIEEKHKSMSWLLARIQTLARSRIDLWLRHLLISTLWPIGNSINYAFDLYASHILGPHQLDGV